MRGIEEASIVPPWYFETCRCRRAECFREGTLNIIDLDALSVSCGD